MSAVRSDPRVAQGWQLLNGKAQILVHFPGCTEGLREAPGVLWQRATACAGSNSLKRLQMETESLPKLAHKEATVKLTRKEEWQETGFVKDMLINYAPILKKKKKKRSVSINHNEENLEAEKSSGRESRHRVTQLQITCGKPSLISKRSEWS